MGSYSILDRMARYAEFSEMEFTPEISTALDITADEIVGGDDRGKAFHIYSKNPKIKTELDDLFYDVLNVEFNLKPWCRNLVKHGDFFLYNEVLPDIGVINVTPIAVNEIEREEGYDMEDPYAVRFKWLTRGNKYLENWQVSHFRILSNDLHLPYGTSVLESARRIWRQLCHEKGTRVWTQNGWKEIQDVVAGDCVYSYDSSKNALVETRVRAMSYMGKQPILSVKTAHREINVTPNHGLLARGPDGTFEYKKASELVPGQDSLVLPKNTIEASLPSVCFDDVKSQCSIKLTKPFDVSEITKELAKYREATGDKGFYNFFKGTKKIGYEKYETLCSYIPELSSRSVQCFRKFTKKPMYLSPGKKFQVDEEFCRFFGFMLGDGWTLPAGFGFALGVDDVQNQHYRNYAKNRFGKLNEVVTPSLPNKRGGAVGYGSKESKLILQKLGFVSGFAKKRIPEWVYEAPQHCRVAFLRGLMDADGSNLDNRITLANKALVLDAKTLAEMSGVATSKKLTEFNRPGRQKSYRITINTNLVKESHAFEKVISLTEKEGPRETYDLQVENELHNFVAEGVVTHNTMLEDAMLVYRVVRSPERRVFYIDVGNIDPNDVPSYMEAAKATLRSRGQVDRETGREDQRLNAMSVLDDYFIPVRGNAQGTKVETLAGASHATATEDVEYIQSKMFAALKVPKPYMNFDENLSAKASLSQMDVRFSRTIQSFQKIIVAELNKLAMIHLFSKGFDGPDLVDFELKLSNPSSVALQQKLELWQVKFDLGGTAKETKLVDTHWVQKNILELGDEEIATINKGLVKDRLVEMEIEALEPVEPDPSQPAKTTDPFDPTNYEVPGAEVAKEPAPEQDDVHSNEVGLDKFRSYDGEGNQIVMDLEPGKTPISATPFMTRHRRNRKRRVGVSTGRQATAMPNLAAMLSPKNKYNKDITGTRTEAVNTKKKEDLLGIVIDPNLGREMKSIFEKLKASDKFTQSKMLKEQDLEINLDIATDDDEAMILEVTGQSSDLENSDDVDSIDETTLREVFNEED